MSFLSSNWLSLYVSRAPAIAVPATCTAKQWRPSTRRKHRANEAVRTTEVVVNRARQRMNGRPARCCARMYHLVNASARQPCNQPCRRTARVHWPDRQANRGAKLGPLEEHMMSQHAPRIYWWPIRDREPFTSPPEHLQRHGSLQACGHEISTAQHST